MSALSLTGRQIGFELRSFRRNRAGMMFTFIFPIMFLVIFSLGSSDRTASFRGVDIPFIQFFLGGILAYGLIGATYTNLAMRVVNLRESGVLKRVKGTPLPIASYLGGHIGSALAVGVILSAITMTAAVVLYGAHIPLHTLAALIVTIVVGASSFCALGLAIASVVPNADSAPAIVNFTFLPIAFISDIFYSLADAPKWLTAVADFFPVKHFANALQVIFDPSTTGAGFSFGHLGVIALWGLAATAFCIKRFRWESGRAAG